MTNQARTLGFISYLRDLGSCVGRVLNPDGACTMNIVGDPRTEDIFTVGFSRTDGLAPLNLMQRQDFSKKFKRALFAGLERAHILMPLHLDDFIRDTINLKEVFIALDRSQVAIQVCCLDIEGEDDPLMLGFAFTRTGEATPPAKTAKECAEFLRQTEQVRRIRA